MCRTYVPHQILYHIREIEIGGEAGAGYYDVIRVDNLYTDGRFPITRLEGRCLYPVHVYDLSLDISYLQTSSMP
jgi:hypothetical protein